MLLLQPFQSGFRLINGDDLNNLATRLNSFEPQAAYAAATNTTSFTATAAQISGSISTQVLNLTGTLAGPQNLTLPTAASVISYLATQGIVPQVGDSYELNIINSSGGAFAWTVLTNTGWTLSGTMTIAQSTQRRFAVTFTNVTTASAAITLQSLGQIAVTAV
jgi:hypothetical protein